MGISLMYISSFEPSTIGKQQYVTHLHVVHAPLTRYTLTQHDGLPPQTYAEKQEFKSKLNAQKRTPDEENFEEAVAQAYRAWTPTVAPPHLVELFADVTTPSTPFGHLLAALRSFSEQPPHVLPLSATLPDMKSDTESYVRLQNLYRTQAAEDRERFRSLLREPIEAELVDLFVKNAHGVQLLKGARYRALDATPEKLGESKSSSCVVLWMAAEMVKSSILAA
jgi:amyloid beta precursor protein binding protein 1